MNTSRSVPLWLWEQGIMYQHEDWEVYGYSNFAGGVPKYVEIRMRESFRVRCLWGRAFSEAFKENREVCFLEERPT